MDLLIAIQAGAALVTAGASIAMWRATVNLVEATMSLTLASIDPNVSLELPTNPISHPDGAMAVILNDSRFDVSKLTIQVSAVYQLRGSSPGENHAIGKVLDSVDRDLIEAGDCWRVSVWGFAKRAVDSASEIKVGSTQQLAGTRIAFDVQYHHGITHKMGHFSDQYIVVFSDNGDLDLKRVWTDRPGPRDRYIIKPIDSN